jgi:hypothetical protein
MRVLCYAVALGSAFGDRAAHECWNHRPNATQPPAPLCRRRTIKLTTRPIAHNLVMRNALAGSEALASHVSTAHAALW